MRREKMEDRTFKAELQGEEVQRRRGDERSVERAREREGTGKCRRREGGREGGIMKSSGSLVEEATAPAKPTQPDSVQMAACWDISSARFQIRKWMVFKFENDLE